MKNNYSPDLLHAKKEDIYYTLTMFPYPSGYGLHVGHASVFTINDVNARYQRMKGKVVLNPFGFDSFGLPTENYAMQQGKAAWQVTEENVKFFLSQIEALDMSFDMERILVTSDPEYYKWTQWIFAELYRAGLVYRAEKFVNRCPSCQTVLANDQVVDGLCERCKSEIIQKKHPQWFIKITDYADRLIADLDTIDRPEETKLAQKNWIGRSEGAEIDFTVNSTKITVFTTRPDTLFGVTALVLAPENMMLDEYLSDENKAIVGAYRKESMAKTAVQRQQDTKEKSGVFSGIFAIHPLTGEQVPVWFADYVLMDYGTGAVMFVPAHDERDWEFAEKHGIEVKSILTPTTITSEQSSPQPSPSEREQEHIYDGIDKGLVEFAKKMRKDGTKAEEIMREVLRDRKCMDIKFRRQHPIGGYIADFYSIEHKLVIEIDGSIHETEEQKVKDKLRTEDLEKLGCSILRFSNEQVYNDLEYIYTTIESLLNKRSFSEGEGVGGGGNLCYTGTGILINSGQFTGLDNISAKKAITDHLESIGAGKAKITYKLRDWSVSRQRYWGSPIPVYYDENHIPYLVPDSELPVVLPRDIENYKPKGKSPLEDHASFPIYEPSNYEVPLFVGRDKNAIVPDKKMVTRSFVSSLIYNPRNDTYCFLKRDNHYGVAMIGGGSDNGETLEMTAIRESQEETGYIHFQHLKTLDIEVHSMFYAEHKDVNRYMIQTMVVLELLDDQQIPINRESHEQFSVIWLTKEQIRTTSFLGNHQYLLNSYFGWEDNLDYETIFKYNTHNPMPTSYRRECDTLDTFMCSSFYFLRFPDAHNPNELIRKELGEKMFPVDLYTGGKEHTVGHLLYSRFIHKFLYDQGYVNCPEPFAKLVHQGMIMGSDGRKMGKRYGNVIDPLDVVATYGSDAVRTYLMFMGPVEQEKIRNDNALKGIKKFIDRIERACLVPKTLIPHPDPLPTTSLGEGVEKIQKSLESLLHKTVKAMSEDMEKMKYNTAVSKLMILLNAIEEAGSLVSKDTLEVYLHLLAPFAPKISQDIWTKFGHEDDITLRPWPQFDAEKAMDDEIVVPVQINGKRKLELYVSADADEGAVMDAFRQTEEYGRYIGDQTIKKIIYVKGKILNIVI